MRLVIVNKCPFAVGLLWAPRVLVHGRVMDRKESATSFCKKIAEDPSSENCDLISLRPTQYGLGSSHGDTTLWLKARSLAASLRVPSASFLGLFQLRDVVGEPFWWVCAIKSGLISAQSDILFDDKQRAEEHIRLSIKGLLGDFEEEVLCESAEKSLAWLSPLLQSGLLPSRHGRLFLLRQPEPKKTLAVGVVTLILCVVAGFGLFLFLEHRAGQQAMEAARLVLQDKEAQRKALLEHPEKIFPTPWLTAPDPAAVWSTCVPAMLALPLVVNGWELLSASCDGKTVTVAWKHRPGADYLHLPPSAELKDSSQQVVSKLPLATLEPGQGVSYQNLPVQQAISRYLYQLTQEAAAHLKLSYSKKGQTQTVDKIAVVAPWLTGTWELTDVPAALVLDASLAEALRLPGLTLDRVEYDKTSWIFKGQSYVVEK